MNHLLQFVVLCVLFGSTPLLHAGTIDPAWGRTTILMQANKGLIGKTISTQFILVGDDTPNKGAYTTHVTGSDNSVRALVETTESAIKASKLGDLDLHVARRFADNPEDLLYSADSVTYLDEQYLQGKTYIVLQASSPGHNGRSPYRAKVWVDKKTGAPLKIDGVIEKLPIPGAKSADFTVLYKIDEEGRHLPSEVLVNYKISIMFHKANVSFRQIISTWIPKHNIIPK